MRGTYGAWELSEQRPTAFQCFDCPPDDSVVIDDGDDDAVLAFSHQIFAANPGKEFAFGFYEPSEGGGK